LILPDHEIAKLCRAGMITPFDDYLINPASLDVRLGDHIMIELESQQDLHPADIINHTKENPYLLYPDEFILAQTLEVFNIPDTVSGQFALKSSLARSGFEHLLAGWIDPGFNNSVLTLELKNARKHQPLPLWPGMRIGQIIFMQMASTPDVSYRDSGRYNDDLTVTQCK
jgi:dCTP deaminase